MKYIFLFLFICFFSFLLFKTHREISESYQNKEISEVLAAMPKADQRDIEYFFRELIGWGGFGYVLVGKKPMAFDVIDLHVQPFKSVSRFQYSMNPRHLRFIRGFKKWKKYEKFFPMKHFLIFYEKYSNNNILMTLVNKKEFIHQFQNHHGDFEEILQREVSGESLLQEGKETPFIAEVLKNHDALLGILLGYGRENGKLCHQLSLLDSEEKIAVFCQEKNFQSAWTDKEFEEFSQQFASVSWKSEYITGDHLKDLNFIALPGFSAVFDSKETQYWREHYLETKKAMIEFYEGKDFLETTLKLLTS